jgi:hypothetical protein
MKTLNQHLTEDAAPTNTTDGVANKDAAPLFTKSKFAGIDCIEVDPCTYGKCKFGKRPYSRWNGMIEDENLRSYVQSQFHRTDRLIVKDSATGAMTYIKR